MLSPAKTLNTAISEEASLRQPLRYSEPFLARLRDRDPAAFDDLVRDQAPPIGRLVSRLLGWDPDCDDVVQEVFIAAWESLERFRGDSSINTWLYAIAINQCRRQRRQRGRWKRLLRGLREGYSDVVVAERPVNDIDAIHEAIKKLPHRDRELIVLCALEEKPIDEVARLLALRKNTLEVRLHRARKKLKDLLNQSLHEPSRTTT